MLLNERKIKILRAIVNDYIQSAEPIGSRTIAKKYGFGISSATIRNEMSDLEDMGLIVQPHASAGRVPSDSGYRLYVDQLMHFQELNDEQSFYLKKLINSNISQIDYLMQETAKAIALLTNYTTIVSEPLVKKTRVKHVQLVPLDDSTVLLVVITDSKVVKNHHIRLSKAPNFQMLSDLSLELNNFLQNGSLDDMTQDDFDALTAKFGESASIVMPVIEAINCSIEAEDDFQVYTSGVKNILAFPEFSDLDKARGIFQALEEKEILINLLSSPHMSESDAGLQIIIGKENALEQMKNCSIIKANYQLDNQYAGCIGIIGPTRMDYAQVIAVLNSIVKNMNLALEALSGG